MMNWLLGMLGDGRCRYGVWLIGKLVEGMFVGDCLFSGFGIG